MKTIGTQGVEALSDADLRTYIGALVLDVYEAIVMGLGDYEILFAAGTLRRFTDELERRASDGQAVATEGQRRVGLLG